MKRPLLLTLTALTLLMAILACNFISPVTPPTPIDQEPVQTTIAVQPIATDTPVPSPTGTPTSTATHTQTATLGPTNSPQPSSSPISGDSPEATRIQFAPGGAWEEVVGNGQANRETAFVLRAMQGQIMSVSVFEGLGYFITVEGKDGTALTSPNSDDFFWRGVLPSTQDYIVTVMPFRDGDFTLRVAINPLNQAEQMFSYDNSQYLLSVQYTDVFAPVEYPYTDQQRAAPALALNFIDSAFYENTNLSEAYFVLNLFNDPDIVANCLQPSGQEQSQGQETIGGYVFEKSALTGAGVGNIYEQMFYRSVQKNACIEIVFFIHYGNIGNYPPGITEFDRAALMEKLADVLKTFTLE